MRLTGIALNNLQRRKGKTLFLVLGMLIGIATIVTLFTITKSMEEEVGNKFDQIGANMLVGPKSDDLALSYGGVSVSDTAVAAKQLSMTDMDKMRAIKNKENVSIIAPKLLGAVDAGGNKTLAIGVRFISELRMKKWWKIHTDARNPGQVLARPGTLVMQENDLLLGSEAAVRLNKKPGDTIKVAGQDYLVKGVLGSLGSEEDGAVIMDIGRLQTILGKPGAVSLFELSALCNTCPIEQIVAQISEKLPYARAVAVKEAVEARKLVVERFSAFALAISAVILLIGSMVVLLTMMSSVNERTREIGIFRAIGFRKSHVMQIIFTEALVVSFLGGVLGYILGTLAAKLTAPMIAQMDLVINWQGQIGAGSLGLALLVGVAASAFPAWQASRLDPAEALRFI